MIYRDVVKPPWVEDREYCANGNHLYVERDDNSIRCFNCGYVLRKSKK
jgi:hypothetical protein